MLFDTINELDRLGRNLLSTVDRTLGAPVDIHRESDRYLIELDLPGADPSSVDVTLEDQMLVIRAERSETTERKGTQWIVKERGSWSFVRRFNLGEIDPDRIEARFHDGVLTVTVPLAEVSRRHKVPVAIGAEKKTPAGSTTDRGFAGLITRLGLPWRRHQDSPAGKRMRGSAAAV